MRRSTIILFSLGFSTCTASLVPPERTAIFSVLQAENLITIHGWPPENITGYWTPEEDDLSGVEDLLESYLSKTWASMGLERKEMPVWRHYYRQLCGIVQSGEKRLFISYGDFVSIEDPRQIADRKEELKRRGKEYDPMWWKSDVLAVSDGGSQFFRVIFDLKTKRFVWYDDNAE